MAAVFGLLADRGIVRGDRAQHQAARCGRVLEKFPEIVTQTGTASLARTLSAICP
jgi:hypothetical protein